MVANAMCETCKNHGSSFNSYRTIAVVLISIIIVICSVIVATRLDGYFYLRDTEYCGGEWITQSYEGVRLSLEKNLFGQHLAEKVIRKALKTHVLTHHEKPLTLSFNGSVGTGKNYAARWIVNNWFKKGFDSKFLHYFVGSKDFPFKSDLDSYKAHLLYLVHSQAKLCQHQIFIFDEIDMTPPGLLDNIKSFLDYSPKVDGVDLRDTIFLFLSNTGENTLRKMAYTQFESNRDRKSLVLSDEDEEVFLNEIYNSSGTGLSSSRLMDAHLISHFVPFLPLEKEHVRECIKADLHMKVDQRISSQIVEDVLNKLRFSGPEESFSVTGCKGVSDKVNLIVSEKDF